MVDEKFKCEQCDHEFASQKNLNMHKNSAHKTRKKFKDMVAPEHLMEKEYYEMQNSFRLQGIERCLDNYKRTKNTFWLEMLVKEAKSVITIVETEKIKAETKA